MKTNGSSTVGVSLHEYDKAKAKAKSKSKSKQEAAGGGGGDDSEGLVEAPPLDWAPFYLEFDGLMRRLQRVKKEFGMRKAVSSQSLTGETRTLAEILDKEVEKIVLFYLRIQGEVAHRIWNLRERQGKILQGDNVVTAQALDALSQQYREIGYDVLELLEYLEYNVAGLRRIIKRYDNHFDNKMGRLYFDTRLSDAGGENKHSQLLQLYHQEGLRAIIATLRNAFQDIHDARLDLQLLNAWSTEVKRQSSPISATVGVGAPAAGYGTIEQPSSSRIAAFPSMGDVRSDSDVDAEAKLLLLPTLHIDNVHGQVATIGTGERFMQPSPTSHANLLKQKPIPKTSYLSRLTASLSVPQLAGLEFAADETRSGVHATQAPQAVRAHEAGPASGANSGDGSGDSSSNSSIFARAKNLLLSSPLHSAFSLFHEGAPAEAVAAENMNAVNMRRSLSDLEPILRKIMETEERVMRIQARTTSEYLASHSEMALEQRRRAAEDEEGEAAEDEAPYAVRKRKTSKAGLFLNLLVTFLFMANAYIVGPTSGQYAMQLGESRSNGALIIGLSPVAALLSTMMYSHWTNFAFKTPLIVSVTLSVIGNLLYGAALQCESSSMLFCGRLLCGLGAPRVIARRYIADHVAKRHITLASSHFITAGALGLAFGPLVSSVVTLANIDSHIRLNDIELIHFTNVTAPGWIMFLLWLLALIGILLAFEEPTLISSSNSASIQKESCFKSVWGSLRWMCGWIYGALSSCMLCRTHATVTNQYSDIDAQNIGALSPADGDLLDVEIGEIEMSDEHDRIHVHTGGARHRSGSGESLVAGAPTFDYGFEETSSAKNSSNASVSGLNQGKSDSLVSNSGVLDKNNSLNLLNRMRDMSVRSQYFDKSARQKLVHEQEKWTCCSWIWQIFNFEVTVILVIYFVNKVGQEMIIVSIPDLSGDLFLWDMNQAGFFMAAMGALVLPANILLASFREAEDRRLMLPLFVLECTGIFFLLNLGFFEYTAFQYMLGATLLFAMLNAQEGIMMSILSKVTPGESSSKTFTNSGFLATELGILGRVVADVGITVVLSEYSSGTTTDPYFISNMLFVFLGRYTCRMIPLCAVRRVLHHSISH